MIKFKIYSKIIYAWIKLKFKTIFWKRKIKNIQTKRMDILKKEAPKRIMKKVRPGKNVKLFAYDKDFDLVYEVSIKNDRAFINPEHKMRWALNINNAERKLKA